MGSWKVASCVARYRLGFSGRSRASEGIAFQTLTATVRCWNHADASPCIASESANRPGSRGGCLVRVRQSWFAWKAVDDSVPRLRPAECGRWCIGSVSCRPSVAHDEAATPCRSARSRSADHALRLPRPASNARSAAKRIPATGTITFRFSKKGRSWACSTGFPHGSAMRRWHRPLLLPSRA